MTTQSICLAMVGDKLIKKIEQQCEDYRFLMWLHALMLMDDTIIHPEKG